jgi:Family of unknown function (DUF6941)
VKKTKRKTHPTLSHFVICDQARLEMNKKLTVIGWFTGNTIVFHPREDASLKAPFRMPTLGIVFVFKAGRGTFPASFSLSAPKDKVFVKPTKLKALKFDAEGSALVVLQLAGPAFPAKGQYTVRVQLGEKEYVEHFEVATSNEPLAVEF